MKRESYDKAKMLLYRIDDLSSSADNMTEILESLKKNGGTAKLIVHTGGKDSTTEMTKELSETVCTEILKTYNDLIRIAKTEINNIVDDAICSIQRR